jgi:hypothetical protein
MRRALAVALLALTGFSAHAADDAAGTAAASGPEALRARYTELEPRLKQNVYNRPLVIESAESPNRLRGHVYAVVNYPFAKVSRGMNNPRSWCDVFILHINTKYCHATTENGTTTLAVYIGKKTPESLDSASRTNFVYQHVSITPEFMDIRLNAAEGPFGTSNYRVALTAIPLPDNKSFIHLSYSYDFSFTGKISMGAYFATAGSGKVGFSRAPGSDNYIGGMRGLIERNTMRYYLAIDSFLGALDATPAEQLDKRLKSWFAAVEQYPRQLHEVERLDYMSMKLDEYQRQQTAR